MALGYRDASTKLHSERVLQLADALGRWCGLLTAELGVLKIAAAFHDVGKIGIPDGVLAKPGALDAEEWMLMKRHSEMGERIIAALPLDGAAEAARVIRHHHEYVDGRGYPDGLAGAAIPLASRIISIVDSYDAMAETRSYHRAKYHPLIMEILSAEAGVKHDRDLMQVFVKGIEGSPLRARMG